MAQGESKNSLRTGSLTPYRSGYPGPVLHNRPLAGKPRNLAPGWIGFQFEKAFGRPVRIINDAAMQALGGYKGGKMLFLGLGTGLGTTMIVDGIVEPMELSHLPYKKATYEDYVGERALEKSGKKKWRRDVADVVVRLTAALEPDDVVIGGGNARLLKKLSPGCRLGENSNAFAGGFHLWDKATPSPSAKPSASKAKVNTSAPKRALTPSALATQQVTRTNRTIRTVRGLTCADVHVPCKRSVSAKSAPEGQTCVTKKPGR